MLGAIPFACKQHNLLSLPDGFTYGRKLPEGPLPACPGKPGNIGKEHSGKFEYQNAYG
jgi:hypothetical protein